MPWNTISAIGGAIVGAIGAIGYAIGTIGCAIDAIGCAIEVNDQNGYLNNI